VGRPCVKVGLPAGAGPEVLVSHAAEKPGERRRAKAVVLLSGGLDSTLAARLLQEQGVEILGVRVNTYEFDAANLRIDHVVYRILSRAADTDDADPSERFHFRFDLLHMLTLPGGRLIVAPS